MKRLRVGIAGYGAIGPRRHEFIAQHPSLQVVGISDTRFPEDSGPDAKGVRRWRSYMDLIGSGLDVLFVCLTNDAAPEATIAGLEAGLHVFCEKPPGRTVEDVRRVIEAEKRRAGLKLKYGFNHRYHDSVREALKLSESGAMGRLINMRGVYGKSALIPWPRPLDPSKDPRAPNVWRTSREIAGGGILLDQGIHMVDLMRAFAGEFPRAKSFVRNSFWNHDVEDNAYALLESERGVVAMLHSTATQWRHQFSLEVYLEKGALLMSGILSGTKSYGQETLTVVRREEEDAGNPSEQTTTYVKDNSWHDEIFDFADHVLKDEPVRIGGSAEALRTMELVYRIYAADEKWRAAWGIAAA